MKGFFILLTVIFCIGCKEQNTHYTAKLINGTQHNITVLCFKGGIVYKEDTLKLQPNQQIEIANGNQRGLKINPGFGCKYFGGPYDSNIVVYDDIYKVTHYATTPALLSLKYYLFTSLRNISNPNSYKFQSTKVTKYANSNTHEYTFTEDDYLYAK